MFLSELIKLMKLKLALNYKFKSHSIDPLGRPTVPAGSDYYFRTCFRPSVLTYVRTYVPTFKTKRTSLKIIIVTSGPVGLAKGIIDDILYPFYALSCVSSSKKVPSFCDG